MQGRIRSKAKKNLGYLGAFSVDEEPPEGVEGAVIGLYRPHDRPSIEGIWVGENGLWIWSGAGWILIAYAAITSVDAPRTKDPSDPESAVVVATLANGDAIRLVVAGRKGRMLDAFSFATFLKGAKAVAASGRVAGTLPTTSTRS